MTSTTLLDPASSDRALRTRLRPLHVAVALQGTMLWVPVEKLFMSEIGFTAASIGVMAAAYAAVVPLLEVPSGILADRWSRRGVLVVAAVAVSLCALVGGLSHGVGAYIVSALFLGVFFAMYSGTLDSVVYDTVLEETGDGAGFERRIGRVRLIEGLSFAASALAGGLIAGATSPRLTYFLTVSCAALAVVALGRFREPRLHQVEERVPLAEHVRITLRAITGRAHVLPIVAAGALSGVVLQPLFEFGPVWLVTLAVPAFVFGPYWAGLTGTLALGGLLAGRLPLGRPARRARRDRGPGRRHGEHGHQPPPRAGGHRADRVRVPARRHRHPRVATAPRRGDVQRARRRRVRGVHADRGWRSCRWRCCSAGSRTSTACTPRPGCSPVSCWPPVPACSG